MRILQFNCLILLIISANSWTTEEQRTIEALAQRRRDELCQEQFRCVMRYIDYLKVKIPDLRRVKVGPTITKQPGRTVFDVRSSDPNYMVFLECRASGIPEPMYSWMKNDELISFTSDKRVFLSGGKLVIMNPKSGDAGRYQCRATNLMGTTLSNPAPLIAAYVGEMIRRTTDSITASMGKSTIIQCEQRKSVQPGLEYRWEKFDPNINEYMPVVESERIFIAPETGELFLNQPSVNDEGRYRCVVRNVEEQLRNENYFKWLPGEDVSVRVKAGFFSTSKPAIIYRTPTTSILRGRNLTLSCFASARKTPAYTWTLDGQAPSSKARYLNGGAKLFILNVQYSDAGAYKCTAFADDFSVSGSISVTVSGKPYFSQKLPPLVDAAPGDDELIMTCQAQSDPGATYKWFFNGVEITRSSRMTPASNILQFKSPTSEDSGMYQCAAGNRYGNVLTTSQLRVIEIEPTFSRQLPIPSTHYGVEGGKIAIACSPFAVPTPRFSWTFRGRSIANTSDNHIQILPSGSLVLNNVRLSDAGEYTCSARNFAQASHAYRVIVEPAVSIANGGEKFQTVYINRSLTLPCSTANDAKMPEIEMDFIWFLNGTRIHPSPSSQQQALDDYFYHQDMVYGSEDLAFLCSYKFAPSSEFYQKVCESYFRNGRLSSQHLNYNPDSVSAGIMREDINIPLPEFDPFEPEKPIAQVQRERRNRYYSTLQHYGTQFSWTIPFNPLLLQRLHYIFNGDQGDLKLKRAQVWQSGNYQCCVYTQLSRSCINYNVTVIGPSDPPTDVTCNPGSAGDMTLEWKAPFNNGQAITNYVIETSALSRLENQNEFGPFVRTLVTDSAQTLIQIKLTPYMKYLIRVKAINDQGISRPSMPASMVCRTSEALPTQTPTQIFNGTGNPGDLSIQWPILPMTSANGENPFLYVYYRRVNDPGVEQEVNLSMPFSSNRLQINLNNQRNRDPYTIRFRMKNDVGFSPYSSYFTTYPVPNPPTEEVTNVRVYGLSGSSLRVTFRGIDLNLEPTFQGYLIRYWLATQGDFDTANQLYEVSTGNKSRSRAEEVFIWDLKPITSYRLKVYVRNAGGYSRGTNFAIGQTKAAEPTQAPTNVQVSSYSNTAVRVRWQRALPTEEEEARIEGYAIFYWRYDRSGRTAIKLTWDVDSNDREEIIIRGLTTGDRYILQVQAYSVGGYGPRSEPVLFLMRFTTFLQQYRDAALYLKISVYMLVFCVSLNFL